MSIRKNERNNSVALVPFNVVRTVGLGLARSGGRPLIVFAPHEYDFVFFSHWFGGSAGDAKAGTGAQVRLALLAWESDVAKTDFPISAEAKAALRDWAALSFRSETPQVELREDFPPVQGATLSFKHSNGYFSPALLAAACAPLTSLPREEAHREAASLWPPRGLRSPGLDSSPASSLSSTVATGCHKWLALRWLTFAKDVWQAWGKAQPPRPTHDRRRDLPREARHRAYTATGMVARPTRAQGFHSQPTQPAARPSRPLPLAFRPQAVGSARPQGHPL